MTTVLVEISIHAPRAGSDSSINAGLLTADVFQSTLPVRGATVWKLQSSITMIFQSTLPVRGATVFFRVSTCSNGYFNPRSPCGERHVGAGAGLPEEDISIHAPRAGSDGVSLAPRQLERDFNPRSPCGERREFFNIPDTESIFQSTLPVRGATRLSKSPCCIHPISIHAPRAGSDKDAVKGCFEERISIHAPRAGSDVCQRLHLDDLGIFQSTLPVRGATAVFLLARLADFISIHAPRAGSDSAFRKLSTATSISIHAPRAGSD